MMGFAAIVKKTRPMREACEASKNSSSTIVDWTHPITCCNACTIMYLENIFFASLQHPLREATRKPFINLVSLSQAYHFITYNRS